MAEQHKVISYEKVKEFACGIDVRFFCEHIIKID